MGLKPLGHRILVTPDAQADATDSGLVLPQDRDHVPVSGTIAAIGDGPARDQRIRSATIARCIGIAEELADIFGGESRRACEDVATELRRYLGQVERYASLDVGDRVVYPVEAGLKISEDGQDYILLNEDDVVIVATDESEAA